MSERRKVRCEWELVLAPWRCQQSATQLVDYQFYCDEHATKKLALLAPLDSETKGPDRD